MADRYWVGGAGTWDSSTTTNWSATSGGASGASAPTSTDNVFFDANSGTGNINVTSGAVCNDWNVNAITNGLSITNLSSFGVHGNIDWDQSQSTTFIQDTGSYIHLTGGGSGEIKTISTTGSNSLLCGISVRHDTAYGLNSGVTTINVLTSLSFISNSGVYLYVDGIGHDLIWNNGDNDLQFNGYPSWSYASLEVSTFADDLYFNGGNATYTFSNGASMELLGGDNSGSLNDIDQVDVVFNGVFPGSGLAPKCFWKGTLRNVDISPSDITTYSSGLCRIDSGSVTQGLNNLSVTSPVGKHLIVDPDDLTVSGDMTFVGSDAVNSRIIISQCSLSPTGNINATNTTFRSVTTSKSLTTNVQVNDAGGNNFSGRTPKTFTSVTSGDFDDPVTWGGTEIPYGQDDVVISTGNVVAAKLTFQNGSQQVNNPPNAICINSVNMQGTGYIDCSGGIPYEVFSDSTVTSSVYSDSIINVISYSSSVNSLVTISSDTTSLVVAGLGCTSYSSADLEVNINVPLISQYTSVSKPVSGGGASELNLTGSASENSVDYLSIYNGSKIYFAGHDLVATTSLNMGGIITSSSPNTLRFRPKSGSGSQFVANFIGGYISNTNLILDMSGDDTRSITFNGSFVFNVPVIAQSLSGSVIFESGSNFDFTFGVNLSGQDIDNPFILKASSTSISTIQSGNAQPNINFADISYIRGEPDLTWYVYDSNDLGNNEQLYFRSSESGNGLFFGSNF